MKRRRGTDVIVLVVLCAIGMLLGRLQSQSRDRGGLDVVSAVIAKAVNPAAGLFARMADGSRDFVSGILGARSLRSEVRRLKAEEAAMSQYQERVDALSHENDELRRLNGLGQRSGQTRIPADIIAYTPRENRITLNVGAGSGVTPGLAVVCPDGLVGVVSTVAGGSCQVSLLGSASVMIGAMVQRTPPSVGLLQGGGGRSMYIDFNDPKAEVKEGDLVVTSGFSEKIPRSIVIGRVLRIDDIPEMGQRRAEVFPSANVAAVNEVIVLR